MLSTDHHVFLCEELVGCGNFQPFKHIQGHLLNPTVPGKAEAVNQFLMNIFSTVTKTFCSDRMDVGIFQD